MFTIKLNFNKHSKKSASPSTQIDQAASLQPTRALKLQIPLALCKGRGHFPAHEEDHACLPSGSIGSILGKAMSATDFWNTMNKQTNKQTNHPLTQSRGSATLSVCHITYTACSQCMCAGCPMCVYTDFQSALSPISPSLRSLCP